MDYPVPGKGLKTHKSGHEIAISNLLSLRAADPTGVPKITSSCNHPRDSKLWAQTGRAAVQLSHTEACWVCVNDPGLSMGAGEDKFQLPVCLYMYLHNCNIALYI